MLFHKVIGENEKCVFYFYLKTDQTFWSTDTILYPVYSYKFLEKIANDIVFLVSLCDSLLLVYTNTTNF